MKTRLYFVANSSSSSFIIAYKRTVPKEGCCPTCKRPYKEVDDSDTDIMTYMESKNYEYACDGCSDSNTYIRAKTLKEIKEEINFGFLNNDTKDYINKCVKDGYEIGMVQISRNEEFYEDLYSFQNTIIINREND